jgi:hypothetical protein
MREDRWTLLKGSGQHHWNQFGFMPKRSIMEVIFLIRQLMERYRQEKKDLHMVFIDLEKAYDKVTRNVMWWVLQKHKVSTKYITSLRICMIMLWQVSEQVTETHDFPINIGLHQGSALSLYLFFFGDRWGHKRYTRWYPLVHALYRWRGFDGWENDGGGLEVGVVETDFGGKRF